MFWDRRGMLKNEIKYLLAFSFNRNGNRLILLEIDIYIVIIFIIKGRNWTSTFALGGMYSEHIGSNKMKIFFLGKRNTLAFGCFKQNEIKTQFSLLYIINPAVYLFNWSEILASDNK